MSKQLIDVDPATLLEWIKQDKVVVIDVREPYEYAVAHIGGAHLLPVSTFSVDQLPNEPDKTLVFHCKAGVRSANIAHTYMQNGPDTAYHMAGGMDLWLEQGMPTEGGEGGRMSVDRQSQLIQGSALLSLTALATLFHNAWLAPVAVIGLSLIFAGLTGIDGLSIALSKFRYANS